MKKINFKVQYIHFKFCEFKLKIKIKMNKINIMFLDIKTLYHAKKVARMFYEINDSKVRKLFYNGIIDNPNIKPKNKELIIKYINKGKYKNGI